MSNEQTLRAALEALCAKLPKPDGLGYPSYFARAELEACRAALSAPPQEAPDQRAELAAECKRLVELWRRDSGSLGWHKPAAAGLARELLRAIDRLASTPVAQLGRALYTRNPVGWLESPHGAFRANPGFRLEGALQCVQWSLPVFLLDGVSTPVAQPPQEKPQDEALTDVQILDAARDAMGSEYHAVTDGALLNFASELFGRAALAVAPAAIPERAQYESLHDSLEFANAERARLALQVKQADQRGDEALRRAHVCEKALAELVALRDLKDGLPASGTWQAVDATEAYSDYLRRKPIAWANARAALAAEAEQPC